MNKLLLLCSVIVCLFTGATLYSKTFDQHIKDARACIGYAKANDIAKSRFDFVIKFFYQEEIDQKHGDGPRITQIRTGFRQYVPGFTTGRYSHRIVFHNGFTRGDSFYKLSLAMRLQLKKASPDDKWKQYEPQILKVFRTVQNEFYDSVRNKFRGEYGAIITDDDQRDALIKVLYYIHLLGDYEKSANEYTQGCLLEYFELEEDLCQSLRKLGCGNTSSLEKEIRHTSSADNSERAAHVLQVLEDELPDLIKENDALKEALLGE